MAGQLTGSASRAIDGLVAGARADRDAAVNTVDAVNRQTKAASDEIARTVVTVPPPKPEDFRPAAAAHRDDRFDPEEWNGVEQARAGSTPVPPKPRARHDDDEDDYPDTWLR